MAYTSDKNPSGLTALTSLATDDTFVVGDTSDASEATKAITKANLITDLTTSFATAGHTHTGVYEPADATILKDADIGVTVAAALGADDNYVTDAEKTAIGTISSKLDSSSISDTAYGAGWNADTTHAPSKNAVYDEIELRSKNDTTATHTAQQIELGHATDTTLSRSSAGVIAVEGVVIPSISSTNTLTNKRVSPRTGTTTSSATPTINTDNVDFYSLTAQAVDITSFTTNLSGTPTEGQKLWISVTGTAARALTWGASFEASTVALPTTTVSTNRLDVGFVWNTVTSKWRCVATS